MNNHFYHFFILKVLFLIPFSVFSQPEILIQSKSYGYSFKSPAGWIHQDLKNGNHLFGSNSVAGIVAIIHHAYDNIEEVKAYAQSNGIEEDYMSLQPIGEIEYFSSNGITGTFKGWIDGSPAKAAVICLFSPNGGGVSIYAATSPDKFSPSYTTIAKTIANSTQFYDPIESDLVKEWKEKLSNKKLIYYNTTDNAAEKATYFLYENGWFIYADESSYSSTDHSSTFSAASTSDNGGKWKIIGDENEVLLELIYNDGSIYAHSIKQKEGSETQIMIDGNRFFTKDL